MSEFTQDIQHRQDAKTIISQMIAEELILQGDLPVDAYDPNSIRANLYAHDPTQDETITRPAWEVCLYVKNDTLDVSPEAMQQAIQNAAMHIPALADHFHDASSLTSPDEVRQLMQDFTQSARVSPEDAHMLETWLEQQSSGTTRLEHSGHNESVYMRIKPDIDATELYQDVVGREDAIMATILERATQLTDKTGQPVLTQQELQQLSDEQMEITLHVSSDNTHSALAISVMNEEYQMHPDHALHSTSVLAKLSQDERETLLSDALAVHSPTAYPLLASPGQVHQNVEAVAQQQGIDATALLSTSQLQSTPDTPLLPELIVRDHSDKGYTTMKMEFALPYGTDLGAVIEDVITYGHKAEQNRHMSGADASIEKILSNHLPGTILGAGDITYNMPITQKAAQPAMAMV